MSNGSTSVFVSVLSLAAAALAESDRQRGLAAWFAIYDQGIFGLGAAGFDIGELPWLPGTVESDRDSSCVRSMRRGRGRAWSAWDTSRMRNGSKPVWISSGRWSNPSIRGMRAGRSRLRGWTLARRNWCSAPCIGYTSTGTSASCATTGNPRRRIAADFPEWPELAGRSRR